MYKDFKGNNSGHTPLKIKQKFRIGTKAAQRRNSSFGVCPELSRNLYPESSRDYAILWNDKYIDCDETDNGYYEYKGDVLTVDRESFKDRIRHLEKYAYIVVPKGSATACMMDRTPTERFLERVVNAGTIEEASLKTYLNETRPHHSREITMYN